MTRVRGVLSPVAAVWLACHAAVLATAIAPVSSGLAAQAAGPNGATCTCTHGDGADATCPMHHQTTTGSKVCVMRGTDDSATAAIGFAFGPIGLLPSRTPVSVPRATFVPAPIDTSTPAESPTPPDPPPPRA
jgi:hypothetical protein